MRGPHAHAGVLAAVGPARQRDLTAFSTSGLSLIRLRAQVNPVDDLVKWRDAGATAFILQLLSPLPAQRFVSPQSFIDQFSSELEAFLSAGGRYIEIQDEPNRADRGAGVTWQDGAGFGVWFTEVARCLHQRFGDGVRIGFPALAPSEMPRPEPAAPVDEATFLAQCQRALAHADWAALHVYWRTLEEMRAFDGAMRFLRVYLEAFPDQEFVITEFANVSPGLADSARGRQYAEFFTLMAQYDRILGASAFLLRSGDPHFAPLGLLAPDGAPRATIEELARRPRVPDPRQLWFVWPTDVRHYTQVFGEDQRGYYDCCRMSGGHNGVDLGVDPESPETSPVYAALPGTVVQVAYDEGGYGHHVRVRSYGPAGEEITLLYAHLSIIEVTIGTLVSRGDPLGRAGVAASTGTPHLHLGMRVGGVRLPPVNDALNPRPYLETRPRGLPREPYARTYVLLPPEADSRWAAAVVAGGWEGQRLTFGGSADDAGMGALELRRVVAVNPSSWDGDLAAFFEAHYPGVLYVPIEVETPDALRDWLRSLPALPDTLPVSLLPWPFGLPRTSYARTYVLLPPSVGSQWALAVVAATWEQHRFTIGRNPDDAAIGDLDVRRVIAINPQAWSGDLEAFYEAHYPGVELVIVEAQTPDELREALVRETQT
ncbi:MAG: M23 family metallopeptidase [Anaerolineae bacterium]